MVRLSGTPAMAGLVFSYRRLCELCISTGLVSWFLFILCALLDLGLWLVGLTDAGVIAAGTFGWTCLLIFALGMLYLACALFLNELFQKQILPIGEPLFKPGAQVESGENVASSNC